jgi:hypothetical protein
MPRRRSRRPRRSRRHPIAGGDHIVVEWAAEPRGRPPGRDPITADDRIAPDGQASHPLTAEVIAAGDG